MFKILLSYTIVACFASLFFGCIPNGNAVDTNRITDTLNYSTIQWLDSIQPAGNLHFGDQSNITFRFKNIGDKPLYIISAEPGCGCTVAGFPKEAIAPGAEGKIVAGFDTKNQHEGNFRKNITVVTNSKYNTTHNLIFWGEIYKEAKDTIHTSPADTTLSRLHKQNLKLLD